MLNIFIGLKTAQLPLSLTHTHTHTHFILLDHSRVQNNVAPQIYMDTFAADSDMHPKPSV